GARRPSSTVPERRLPAGSGPAPVVPTMFGVSISPHCPGRRLDPTWGHGPPASDLPTPRRRTHRAPHRHPRAPGALPAGGGRPGRRRRPATVRRAGVPRLLALWSPGPGLHAAAVCRVCVRASRAVLLQAARLLSELGGATHG